MNYRTFINLSLIASTLLLTSLHSETQNDIPYFGTTETSIASDTLRLESTGNENHFHFAGNVEITGNNLTATCDKMEVVSGQQGETSSQNLSNIGDISVIYAYGNVTIKQGGQTTQSDRAVIYPSKSYIELIDNVTILNEKGTVTGPRFIWEKDKPAYIAKEDGKRPTLQLNIALPKPEKTEPTPKPTTTPEEETKEVKPEEKPTEQAKQDTTPTTPPEAKPADKPATEEPTVEEKNQISPVPEEKPATNQESK